MSAELLATARLPAGQASGIPGSWTPGDRAPAFEARQVADLLADFPGEPLYVVDTPARQRPGIAVGGAMSK